MKKIIYTNSDGNLCVVTPVINTHTLVDGEVFSVRENISEDQAVERAWSKLPASAVNPQIVDESAIPADRTFRNAWKATDKGVEHDIPKCKVMAHNVRRAKREQEFKPYDDIIAKQIPGKSATEAEAARQAIRDKYDAVQAAIDAAGSVEEIKAALA